MGKNPKKIVKRKLILKSRRSTTFLSCQKLEGAFLATIKCLSITLEICTTSPFFFTTLAKD
jgi:hypothetical protein